MAHSLEKPATDAGEGEISNCVSNLVQAFTNGLDIFRRLRERRRKRKRRNHSGQNDATLGAELQLSNSLRRAPHDIKSSYQNHYSKAGDPFAKGDAIAHRSLAETLIKLNTGLVGIITAFLNHDSKSSHLHLDYKSLTSLSNASREEALNSLDQLAQRLNRSQLQVYRMSTCPRCGSSKHQNCSGNSGHIHSSKHTPQLEKTKYGGTRVRSNGPMIARIPVKSSSQTQLVVVRPKNTRKHSSSRSSSSSRTQSTSRTPPYASPQGSPLPQYAPVDPFPPVPPKPANLRSSPSSGQTRRTSLDGPQPTTWPRTRLDATAIPLQLPPTRNPTPQRSPPLKEKRSLPPVQEPIRRRMDKVTLSTYTFASDSTKLGEIPQRNWTVPFDYAEAERLNAEALVNGYPHADEAEGKPKAKKGLFRFLRRGTL